MTHKDGDRQTIKTVTLVGNTVCIKESDFDCLMGGLHENKTLKQELEASKIQINDLRKKRSRGEINEAYAKTIESNKELISNQLSKINRLQQKLESKNKQLADAERVIDLINIDGWWEENLKIARECNHRRIGTSTKLDDYEKLGEALKQYNKE